MEIVIGSCLSSKASANFKKTNHLFCPNPEGSLKKRRDVHAPMRYQKNEDSTL
ncbi:unnamed protein product [Amoebophrya sp. A120]|nr:unnamed protein product [Amoebophrya sp. A120]|eukprot:GSA120T00019902001.1